MEEGKNLIKINGERTQLLQFEPVQGSARKSMLCVMRILGWDGGAPKTNAERGEDVQD